MTKPKLYRCDLFGIENHVGTVWSPRTFETAEKAQAYLDAQRAECKRRWNMDLSEHRVAPVKVTIKLAPTQPQSNGE